MNALSRLISLGISLAGLLCWVVMFLAGTDVWHDVGRPDVWNLAGPPYADLRAFVVGFYLLLVVLSTNAVLTAVGLVTAHKRGRAPA